MLDNFNLDNFEPIFIKGIVSDSSVLSNLSPFLENSKNIFKNKDYALTTAFYKLFFDKQEKIPCKEELSLFLKDNHLKIIKNVLNEVENIDYASIDKDIFYKSAERFIKERGIWSTILSVADDMEKKNISPSEVLSRFEKICSISLDNDRGLDLYEDISKVISFLKEKDEVLKTGYPSIDTNLDGGLLKNGKALYMFMAPPNKGKSLFLGNIACNIANQGKTALVISLEMSEAAYGARFCSQQTAIPFSELHLRANEVKEKLKNRPGKIIIKEFPPKSLTVSQLKSWIKKHIVEKGIKIDIIIIDYLNLLDGTGDNLYEKIKNISEQVRALSYYFSVPCLTATQQNRTASGKEMAGLNSVSESMGIAATADVILEIFQNEEDIITNHFRVGFSKNRYGPVNFAITTKINFETLRITDLYEESEFESNLICKESDNNENDFFN